MYTYGRVRVHKLIPVIHTTRYPYNNCHVTSWYVASCCLSFTLQENEPRFDDSTGQCQPFRPNVARDQIIVREFVWT